ncbi:unnamed protein product [Rotaria sp. Silwood2]|nr:unnamed protein product [Rotaria sp. Silwood2]
MVIVLLFFFITKNVLLKPIETNKDALTYLTQLGYNQNQCNSTSKLPCSLSTSSSIREYQKAFGLKETGQLDKSTKELLNKPRCGNSDTPHASKLSKLASMNSKWKKKHLKWVLRSRSSHISEEQTIQIIHEAFEAWTKHTPLSIERVCTNCEADVVFDFADGDHHDGAPFDGPGRTLAHAFFPEDGRVHFDASEKWTEKFDGHDTNLFLIAVHEIGHALGLDHNRHDKNSIMYPYYQFMDKHRILPDTDRQSIIDIYGSRETRKSLDPYSKMIAVLRNKATHKVLDSNSNKDVYTLDHNGSNYQKWVFIQQDDGTYILKNAATSFVLDSNNEHMYTHVLNGGHFQKWRFHRQNDGSYVMKNLATSRVLDSNGAGNAYPLDSNGGDYQKWFIEAI